MLDGSSVYISVLFVLNCSYIHTKKPPAVPKDSSDSDDVPASEVFFAEKYEVVVECADEFEQESILLRLSQEGLTVRAIVV